MIEGAADVKISTKGRYAARAMFELASREGNAPLPLNVIADAQDISVKYLERIMTALAADGLIGSSRGRQGGYFLVRSASKIRMLDIIISVENEVIPVPCLGDEYCCSSADTCVTRRIWKEVQGAVVNVLSSYTLADMVRLGSPDGMTPGAEQHNHSISSEQ